MPSVRTVISPSLLKTAGQQNPLEEYNMPRAAYPGSSVVSGLVFGCPSEHRRPRAPHFRCLGSRLGWPSWLVCCVLIIEVTLEDNRSPAGVGVRLFRFGTAGADTIKFRPKPWTVSEAS